MCDNLSHSVTLTGIETQKTGNTETPGHDFNGTSFLPFSAKPRFPGSRQDSEKLAWLLLCLTYNKNNKWQQTNKNKT
jgi:hypothetical protein